MRARKVAAEAFADQFAVHNLGADPVTIEGLSCLKSGPSAAERVQDDFALYGRHLNATSRNVGLQFVYVPTRFEFVVPGWGGVVPKVRKIQAKRVQELSMTTVVLDVLTAVPAGWHW